jgi:O-antigen biosynthesis protein WbqP
MFRQWRIGANTTHFSIYKFRTMTVDTPDVATSELKDRNKSVTRVGRFLRRYSLDELPQLINVVRGEMSWIGPRPALYNQEELIEMRREAGIDALLPGLTGWAQVNGRDKLTLAEKVGFDTYYLENLSAGLDAQIVLRTFAVLVSAEGAF